jgi:hypothetical protein
MVILVGTAIGLIGSLLWLRVEVWMLALDLISVQSNTVM